MDTHLSLTPQPHLRVIYELFILWNATPISQRDPDEVTLAKFAKKHGVDKGTLYNWVKRSDFAEKLQLINKDLSTYKTQMVKNAIIDTALEGKPEAQKLYLQTEVGFAEKTKSEVDATVKGTIDLSAWIKAKKGIK